MLLRGETLIFTKSTFFIKVEKYTKFGVVLGGQNHEKSIENHDQKPVCFLHRHFSNFCDFWSIWGSKSGVQISDVFRMFFTLVEFGRPWRPKASPRRPGAPIWEIFWSILTTFMYIFGDEFCFHKISFVTFRL